MGLKIKVSAIKTVALVKNGWDLYNAPIVCSLSGKSGSLWLVLKRQSSSGDHFISKLTAKGSFYVQQIRRYLGLFSARNA